MRVIVVLTEKEFANLAKAKSVNQVIHIRDQHMEANFWPDGEIIVEFVFKKWDEQGRGFEELSWSLDNDVSVMVEIPK